MGSVPHGLDEPVHKEEAAARIERTLGKGGASRVLHLGFPRARPQASIPRKKKPAIQDRGADSQNEIVEVHGAERLALHSSATYFAKIGKGREDSCLAIADPFFVRLVMQIVFFAREPIVHLYRRLAEPLERRFQWTTMCERLPR